MQRFRFVMLACLVPALALFAAGGGCAGKDTSKPVASDAKPSDGKPADGKVGSGKKERIALVGKGTATIKGQVTYDGDPPHEKVKFPADVDKHCLSGDTESLVWEVDPNTKGVKNVVVWVKPGSGMYFSPDQIPAAKKDRTDNVEMDQPHCNFKPHVVAFNPSYFDGKKQVPTGQKFIVKNSAPITHNSSWKGDDAIPGSSDNRAIQPNGGKLEMPLRPAPDNRPGEHLVHISCDIHKFMSAKALVFDHPYYAVTDDKGNFEIKDVPAGVDIYVVAWHEESGKDGFVLPQASPSRQGEKINLKDGETMEKSFKIKRN